MARIRLENISPVALAGRKPGSVFRVEGNATGPTESYWRRRLEEQAVRIVPDVVVATDVPAEDPAPAAAPVSRPARPSKKDVT